MGKIFCLMGKSSTGKDTIYKRILEKGLSLNTIVPYTTRPIRAGEQNGVEYFFTDEEGYRLLESQGKVVEARAYHTFHGLWRYFTVDDGQIVAGKDYLMIATPEAFVHLQEYFGKERVIPLLIDLDDGVRLQRALSREMKQEHPKYEEMCRRFLADCEDFSEEKLSRAGITRRFANNDLEECIGQIVQYMTQFEG